MFLKIEKPPYDIHFCFPIHKVETVPISKDGYDES